MGGLAGTAIGFVVAAFLTSFLKDVVVPPYYLSGYSLLLAILLIPVWVGTILAGLAAGAVWGSTAGVTTPLARLRRGVAVGAAVGAVLALALFPASVFYISGSQFELGWLWPCSLTFALVGAVLGGRVGANRARRVAAGSPHRD